MSIKVASWNVNSIAVRLDRLKEFAKRSGVDVLLLQEIKCLNEKFPAETLKELGFIHQAVHGQKAYNGVAILSKHPLEDVVYGFGDDEDDPAARFVSAKICGIPIACVYVPNGQDIGTDKYAYKMKWLKRLRKRLDSTWSPDQPALIAGDFNVAPDERDVYDPKAFERHILFTPAERQALARVCEFGLVDTFRIHNDEGGRYSWWDYRELAFPQNKGLRIDLMYVTPPLAAKCGATGIDRDERKGDKPSDHVPIWAEFTI